MERLHPHAEELGSADDFDCLEDILEQRHRRRAPALVYEANHDLHEVVREIVRGERARGRRAARRVSFARRVP